MTFLIDNNLSPGLADCLRFLGHEATHVRDLGLAAAEDAVVIAEARSRNAVLLSADSDSPEMLALSGAASPSVIYLTGSYPSEPEKLALLLHNQLNPIEGDLEEGAVVAVDRARIRVRKLPIVG